MSASVSSRGRLPGGFVRVGVRKLTDKIQLNVGGAGYVENSELIGQITERQVGRPSSR
jgi:hypothetical protein